MFGLGRRKTHRQLVKAELGEGFDHFMQAATHAADGVGSAVGPRIHAARRYVAPAATTVRGTASTGWESAMSSFAPLAAAAADGARHAGSAARKARSTKMRAMRKKESRMARRRWSMLTGMLVAGAVVGAAGAMALRRRRQEDWDSYDPDHSLEGVREDAEALAAGTSPDAPMGDVPRTTASVDRVMDKVMDKASEKAGLPSDGSSATTSAIADTAKQTAAKTTEKADGVLGTARTPSRNTRG
jgi:hypothetical protein